MNKEQLQQLKKINAAAAAQKSKDVSPMAIRLILGLAAAAGAFGGLVIIAKAAGL